MSVLLGLSWRPCGQPGETQPSGAEASVSLWALSLGLREADECSCLA